MFGRHDPGDCLVCGTAHCACGPSGAITVVQLPARDGVAQQTVAHPLQADAVQATLSPGSFTTGTYRRPKQR